jgi:cytochrome d ubiquinol oxidase subunit II
MSDPFLLALVLVGSLAAYAVTGGADFGGGVWDLLASGPRRERQRELIAHAIAPVWEANHVWLIVAVVVLFGGFPPAFAAIATALHVPLALLLVGIVLRGSAFVFRAYGLPGAAWRMRWGRVFSVASTLTPVMLGVCAGAIAAGGIAADPATGAIRTDFVSSWWSPFPFAVGLFVLALFAFLAACYLVVEARDAALAADFRMRAIAAALAAGALAWLAIAVAHPHAPRLAAGLTASRYALPFQIATAAAALAAVAALVARRDRLARVCAAANVVLVVAGWALAQYPYLVPPDLTITNAAAPPRVVRVTLIVLVAGSLVLAPSLVYLLRVFKGRDRGA